MLTLRIFVSSPGDVGEERLLAPRVIARVQGEFAGRAALVPLFWEHEPLRATASFQEQLPRPSTTEIAVFILWTRLGTRLPAHLTRPDGSRYTSGTAFEFEDAIQGYRQHAHPDVLVYRKSTVPMIPLGPEAKERVAQKEALDAFLDAWFRAPDGALTAAFHPFGSPAQFEELLETHLHRLLSERLPPPPAQPEGPTAPALWTRGSPFRGLEAFESEYAPVFCGRTRAISEVLEALRQQDAAGRAFVLVCGPSGVGKSSLVRAGVLPSLTPPGVIEGIGLWRHAVLRPGDPCAGVAEALLRADALPSLAAAGITSPELARLLRESRHAAVPLLKTGLAQAAAEVQRQEALAGPPVARLVLLVDQLEEIFAQERVTPTERSGFVAALSALARSGQVWVLATLRSDFAPRCAELPELLALKEGAGQYDLRPPTAGELGQMIRQPAHLAGLRFEAETETAAPLDDVLRDAALQGPEVLPLLEFSLQALYESRTAHGLLTHAAYAALGGLEGALARRAEAVFTALPAAAQAALPTVLSALVGVGLGDPDSVTRRRAPLDPLLATAESRALIEAFVAARLFVADRAGDGTAVVSVVHEALLRHWPRVYTWLEANRDFLRRRAQVATAAALWQEAEQAADLLLPAGRRLQQAAELLATRRADLSAELTTYIERSLARRRRERRLKWTAAAAAMLMCLGTGLWWWDAYLRPHVAYYARATSRRGSPEGVGRLTAAAARHRSETRKFHSRGRLGSVEKVEFVNGAGACPWLSGGGMPNILDRRFPTPGSLDDLDVRVCQITYERDAAGRVITEKSYDRHGTLVFEATHDPVRQTAHYMNAAGFAHPLVPSGAAYVKFLRAHSGSEAGLDKEVRYFDHQGNPQPNAEGSFGMRQEFEAQGLPIRVSFLGADGAARPLESWGVAQMKFAYDNLGNLTEIAMLDANGRPTLGNIGAARMVLSLDAYGNQREITFLDREGRPVIASMWGCAKTTLTHDDPGNPIEQAYFDAEGQLMLNETQGFAKATMAYDALGRPTTIAVFGADVKPMVHPEWGAAKMVTAYDARGELIESAHFGPDGQRMVNPKRGFAKFTNVFDARGKLLERAFFGANGALMLHEKEGFAKATIVYDEHGNATASAYLGPDGRLMLNEKMGFAQATMSYDARGNRTVVAFFDPDGQPMLNEKRGCAEATQAFDAGGNLTEQAFFGPDGHLMLNEREGFAKATWVYDERGDLIVKTYFGPEGEPMLYQNRYAQVTYRYGNAGHLVEAVLWDLHGQKLPPSDVTIVGVEADGRAAQLGLQSGDIILAYAGTAVPNSVTFNRRAKVPGEGLRELRILRGTDVLTLQVPPGELGIRLEDHEIGASEAP